MKRYYLFICLIYSACHVDVGIKRSPLAIEKQASFIHLDMKVFPYSKDSIIVKMMLTNNGANEFLLYKPLLPFASATEHLYFIMDATDYNQVEFKGHNKEKYLQYDDGAKTDFVAPNLAQANFIPLKPHERLQIKSNIARQFDFEKFLDKNQNEFQITYIGLFPYMLAGKQVFQLDTVHKETKPVYYNVTFDRKDDPDSMRIAFKIPHHR